MQRAISSQKTESALVLSGARESSNRVWMIFINQIKISWGLKKWALPFCREDESWIRLNKWRIYLILDVCPSWRENKIKGFVHRMDWGWKCDSEYFRIRKQMQHCRLRNLGSVVAASIMGWCKVEDTVFTDFNCNHLHPLQPDPSTSSERWHGTALTCKRRAIKIFQISAEAPVVLFSIHPSTSERSWNTENWN